MGKIDANFLLQQIGPEALWRLLEDDAAWPPETASQSIGDGQDLEEVSVFDVGFYELEEETAIPPRKWLFGKHYIRGYASLTIAPGGVGKSALTTVEALSIATGRRLLYHAPRKPLRVWLWNLEDPLEEIRRRVVAIAKHFGISREDLWDRLILTSGRDLELKVAKTERDGLKLNDLVINRVIKTVREKKVDVLIIDPFVSSHFVSENDNMGMDAVTKAFSEIAGKTDCAIELVHHSRKGPSGSAQEMTADDARGASAVINAARSARLIRKMTNEEADNRSIKEPWRYFRTSDAKSNLAPPEAATWYQFEGIELRNGTEDYDDDSVGVVRPWSYPSLTEDLPSDVLRQVQAKVRAGNYRESPQARDWVGYALSTICNLDPYDSKQKKKLDKLIRQWIDNDVLRIVRGKGTDRHDVNFIEIGVPL